MLTCRHTSRASSIKQHSISEIDDSSGLIQPGGKPRGRDHTFPYFLSIRQTRNEYICMPRCCLRRCLFCLSALDFFFLIYFTLLMFFFLFYLTSRQNAFDKRLEIVGVSRVLGRRALLPRWPRA